MSRLSYRIGLAPAALLSAAVLLGGCKQAEDLFKTDTSRWLDASAVVKAPDTAGVMPILPSYGPLDSSEEVPPGATFPREGDWTYEEKDYVIGPTDMLQIMILDLYVEGQEATLTRQVSDTGYIDLPLLPTLIKAAGYTKDGLRDEIVQAYSPDILREPTVTVLVVAQHQNMFSTLGALARPGTYNLIRPDMRLLDALALTGGITQTNIQWIYVIRPQPAARVPAAGQPRRAAPPRKAAPATEGGAALEPGQAPAQSAPAATSAVSVEEALRELGAVAGRPASLPGEPASEPSGPAFAPAAPPSAPVEPSTGAAESTDSATPAGRTGPPDSTSLPGASELPQLAEMASSSGAATQNVDLSDSGKVYKWVYTDGRWVRVEQEAAGEAATLQSAASAPEARPARPAAAPTEEATRTAEETDRFGWKEMQRAGRSRTIAIDLKRLRAGVPEMNIVIRDNDVINVPMLEMGEFYIMGEVLRPGVYSLTGRKITVKMAVAAAGNLGALAWPQNTILVRRIGDNQEQIIPLDLEAIFHGEEPDMFLKPDDLVAVGTSCVAIFQAVLRNAFRATYGFGFIYDRNFANPAPGENTLNSKRFSRW